MACTRSVKGYESQQGRHRQYYFDVVTLPAKGFCTVGEDVRSAATAVLLLRHLEYSRCGATFALTVIHSYARSARFITVMVETVCEEFEIEHHFGDCLISLAASPSDIRETLAVR